MKAIANARLTMGERLLLKCPWLFIMILVNLSTVLLPLQMYLGTTLSAAVVFHPDVLRKGILEEVGNWSRWLRGEVPFSAVIPL